MNESSPSEEYDYAGDELAAMAAAENYNAWLIDEITPWLRGAVAEIGAGVGTLSRRLLARPITSLHAFEPAPGLFPRLVESLRGDPRATAVNATLVGGTKTDSANFDTIVYMNVLEHIEDDGAELHAAAARLRPGGHLVVYSPALPWLLSDFDRRIGHVRRYTREELATKLATAGLEVMDCRYMDLLGVLPWYLAMVLARGDLDVRRTRLYDRWAVPVTRRLEGVFRPPLGKNVFASGRRPMNPS